MYLFDHCISNHIGIERRALLYFGTKCMTQNKAVEYYYKIFINNMTNE